MTGSFGTIPGVLREYEQWVCWREKQRDGKTTKIPIDPETRSFASVSDPDTWTHYELAAGAASAEDGIGFVFTEDDPFIGVDLDDCRNDEELTPWARDIVERLDSYTEVSPSGEGLHVLVEGEIPSSKSRKYSIECYDSARFFTMTGNRVAGTPRTIETRQSAFNGIYNEYVDTKTSTRSDETGEVAETGGSSVKLSDTELVDKAKNAKNGAKFTSLWNGTTAGYESQSEADMALCCLLAFWTGNDPARIDRLFRDSGLYRDKWDETHYGDGATYGEGTIERAIEITDDTFDGNDTNTSRTQGDRPSTATATDTEDDDLLEDQVLHLTDRVTTLERRLANLEAEQKTPQEPQDEPWAERTAREEAETATDSGKSSTSRWTRLTNLFRESKSTDGGN